MRHVSDGELHAFLDGALDLLPEARGEGVRDHLSVCAACRERLQDEERLRSEANTLLGNPDLGEVTLPTFEELRERAEAPGLEAVAGTRAPDGRSHYRGPLKGLPMAWAATIVLALGVGWMGGQVWETLPRESVAPSVGLDYPSQERTPQRDSDLRARSEEGEPRVSATEVRAEISGQAQSAEGAPVVTDAAEDVLAALPPSVELPGRPEISQLKTEDPQSAARTGSEVRPSAAGNPAFAESAERARSLAYDRLVRVVDSGPLNQARAISGGAPTAPGISPLQEEALRGGLAGDVEDSLLQENSFAIPGLKVVSIGFEERVPGEKALLVQQFLPPGDTIELRYFGMLLGTDPESRSEEEAVVPLEESSRSRVYASILQASLPPDWHQVVMERGRGLLVARGSISEANLKGLVKTLR